MERGGGEKVSGKRERGDTGTYILLGKLFGQKERSPTQRKDTEEKDLKRGSCEEWVEGGLVREHSKN